MSLKRPDNCFSAGLKNWKTHDDDWRRSLQVLIQPCGSAIAEELHVGIRRCCAVFSEKNSYVFRNRELHVPALDYSRERSPSTDCRDTFDIDCSRIITYVQPLLRIHYNFHSTPFQFKTNWTLSTYIHTTRLIQRTFWRKRHNTAQWLRLGISLFYCWFWTVFSFAVIGLQMLLLYRDSDRRYVIIPIHY